MFERFTDKGRKIIILAREEAERHQNDYLGTEHLVLAILRESDGIALMILKKMGLSTEQIRLEIERNLPGGGTTMTFGEIPFSPRVKKVIEYGVEEARLLGHNHIGSEHLLLGPSPRRGRDRRKDPPQLRRQSSDRPTIDRHILAEVRPA